MRGMTGYACREVEADGLWGAVELRGYNSRFLDLSVSLPPGLAALETEVRAALAARFRRGKIDAVLRARDRAGGVRVTVNMGAAAAYRAAAERLAAAFDMDRAKPGIDTLLGLEGVLEIVDGTGPGADAERYRRLLLPLLDEAAAAFDAERVREGRCAEEDILGRLAILEARTADVAAQVPVLEAAIGKNLRERFAAMLGGEVDERRVLQEIAALLVKYSIAEELARLAAHLDEFRRETARNPSPGKKLDFLCQEINREVNTIGSKTPALEVSRAVVEMKQALEDIREQLRNVE